MKAKVGLLLLFVKVWVPDVPARREKSWSTEIADSRANHSNHVRLNNLQARNGTRGQSWHLGCTRSLTLNYRLFPSRMSCRNTPNLHTPAPYPQAQKKRRNTGKAFAQSDGPTANVIL